MERPSLLNTEAVRDAENAIREKDDLIQKAELRLLRKEDWKKVSESKAL